MNWQLRHWANAVLIVSLAGLAGYALFLQETPVSCAIMRLEKKAVLTADQTGLDRFSKAVDSIGHFTWSPDSSMLAAYSRMGTLVTIWGIDGARLREFKRRTFSGRTDPIFLRGGKHLLTSPAGTETEDAHKAFSVWNVETEGMIRTVDGPAFNKTRRSSWPSQYAASPSGDTVAYISGHVNQPAVLYETTGWTQQRVIPVVNDLAFSIAFFPDGAMLAIGTVDAEIILVNLRDPGAEPVKFRVYEAPSSVFEQPINTGTASLAFSPDGRFLAVGATICSGRPVINAGSNEDEPANVAIAHAPVKVFRLADRKVIAAYPGHLAPIMRASWTPDSRFLAVAAGDNTVRIFIPAQPELGGEVLKFDRPLSDASFSPDGRFLAAAAGQKLTIYEVKAPPVAPEAR